MTWLWYLPWLIPLFLPLHFIFRRHDQISQKTLFLLLSYLCCFGIFIVSMGFVGLVVEPLLKMILGISSNELLPWRFPSMLYVNGALLLILNSGLLIAAMTALRNALARKGATSRDA